MIWNMHLVVPEICVKYNLRSSPAFLEVGDRRLKYTKDLNIISLKEYKIWNFSPLWHIVGQVTRANRIKYKMVFELWPKGTIHRHHNLLKELLTLLQGSAPIL